MMSVVSYWMFISLYSPSGAIYDKKPFVLSNIIHAISRNVHWKCPVFCYDSMWKHLYAVMDLDMTKGKYMERKVCITWRVPFKHVYSCMGRKWRNHFASNVSGRTMNLWNAYVILQNLPTTVFILARACPSSEKTTYAYGIDISSFLFFLFITNLLLHPFNYFEVTLKAAHEWFCYLWME